MPLFKAFIRVVKSIGEPHGSYFGSADNVVKIPAIEAENKDGVKDFLRSEYPQFFQNGKVYERETKDTAQFFYVVIYPLYNHEVDLINQGEWTCASCGHVHENRYISMPRFSRLFGEDVLFCRSGSNGEYCLDEYKKRKFANVEMQDDLMYVKADSPIYIYKVAEKTTGKCYIGKTRNAPFFRWWNHLTKSTSPFGVYLQKSKLSDWVFEVLEEFPANTSDSDILRIESEYIVKFNSIQNGFNSVISNKDVLPVMSELQGTLFEE